MQANDQFAAPPLRPVLKLLRSAWKVILAGGLGGAALATGYLAVAVPQYEASAMISMAQVPVISNVNINATLVPVANIEEPAFLIERLKMPSTYTPATLEACGMGQSDVAAEAMSRMVVATRSRAVSSVIVISARRESPQLARQCVNGLFEMIRAQQAALAKPIENDLQVELANFRARLAATQGDLEKVERQGLYQSVFLARREELTFLNQQILTLSQVTHRMKPATLSAPIYASANRVAPKRLLVLIAATLAGLFGGLLLATISAQMRVTGAE
jgi:capsular polysaccharide biosynthesis protein